MRKKFIGLLVVLIGLYSITFAQEKKALYVFDESNQEYLWYPSGWMPNGAGILFQENFKRNCASGKTCIKIIYDSRANEWVGIYWLPNGYWFGMGINVYDHLKIDKNTPVILTFWAKGENGGEKVEFKVGGVCDNNNDSIKYPRTSGWVSLSTKWKRYKIDLSDENLSNVVGAFCWTTNEVKNVGKEKIVLYLDDIKFEEK